MLLFLFDLEGKMTILTKVCFRCGKEKPLDEFFRDSKRPLGRSANCKPWHVERQWKTAQASASRVNSTTTRKCARCGEENFWQISPKIHIAHGGAVIHVKSVLIYVSKIK